MRKASVSVDPSKVNAKCGACGLYKKCITPKMEVAGKGRKSILIVSAFPGRAEDREGVPLVGQSGAYLERELGRVGVDLRRDCWLTNALICHPGDTDVKSDHVKWCRPNVVKTITDLKPKTVLLLGKEPCQSVVSWLWGRSAFTSKEGVELWTGMKIPAQKINAWVLPTYNPAYVLRNNDGRKNVKPDPVPQILFRQHLKHMIDHVGDRPWDTVPDWRKDIDVILDVDKAARIIRKMIARGGLVAFDYEGTTLKPESPKAQIVSCSVCWNGKKTIAYPWAGEAITATSELLKSPLGKIAANQKFEDRWTRRILGHRVRNWVFDTMLAAHIIDNRPGITGLDFQAFANLGLSVYSEHIKPYLKSKGSMTSNKIRQISTHDLLLYNGLDSLVEYKLAMHQTQQLGITL